MKKYITFSGFGLFWKRQKTYTRAAFFDGKRMRTGKHAIEEQTNIIMRANDPITQFIAVFESRKSAVAYRKSSATPKLFSIRPVTLRYKIVRGV